MEQDIIEQKEFNELIERYKTSGISQQIDHTKLYLYSIITHSTAIEGSTVTEVENQLLFDQGIGANGKSIMEQMMNLDLKEAYQWGIRLFEQHPDITPELLKQLSAKAMARTGTEYNTMLGTFSSSKGELRLLNVSAGFEGPSYLSWQKVPARLEAFCKELNRRRKETDRGNAYAVYSLSFEAHYELVSIHPWANGNGRSSRLLMNLLQMENGFPPMKVRKDEKAEYIQALIDTREKEDMHVFNNLMLKLHYKHLQDELQRYEDMTADETNERK